MNKQTILFMRTQEGECLPAPTSFIVMPSTTWPWQHSTSYGVQSQDVVVLEHDNGSYGSVPACDTNCLPPLPSVIGSSVPLANSLNGFLALSESTNEDIVPSCVVIGPRPIPISCTPQESVHLHPSQPLPLAALPTNPHLLEGPMMFGTLMESEAPLVGIDTVSGPTANYYANSVASLASSHHHSPAILTTSTHQLGTHVLALHGIVEAMQPRELCGSL